MERRKFLKAIVFILVWVLFLSVLITNRETINSVQWQDLWETIMVSGVGDIIKWNAGYFLLFSLFFSVMALCVRHIRNKQFMSNDYDEELERRRRNRLHSPAYSSLPGNIHHETEPYNPEKAFDN